MTYKGTQIVWDIIQDLQFILNINFLYSSMYDIDGPLG
jgi:hypothetical protein